MTNLLFVSYSSKIKFKPRQRRLAVLKYSLFLVCSLIFIEYQI